MSELARFARKPFDKKIGDKVWKFKSLGPDDLPLFLSMQNTEDKVAIASAIKELMKKYILDNIPDATDKEITDLPIPFIMDFMDAIYTANGLVDEKKKELIEKVKTMRPTNA